MVCILLKFGYQDQNRLHGIQISKPLKRAKKKHLITDQRELLLIKLTYSSNLDNQTILMNQQENGSLALEIQDLMILIIWLQSPGKKNSTNILHGHLFTREL